MVTSSEPAAPSRGLGARGLSLTAGLVGATWLTLLSYYGPTQISLAAPLSGVVVIGALTSTRRTALLDGGVLVLSTFVVATVMLDSWRLGAVTAATSLVQAAAVVLAWRWSDLWPGQGRSEPTTLATLPRLGLAVTLASVVSSLVRWTGLGVIPVSDVDNVLLVAIRTLTWGLAFGAIGLLWTTERRSRGWRISGQRGARLLEVSVMLALTVGTCWLTFAGSDGGLPVIFPLFFVMAWAALRLCPLAATSLATGLGVVAAVCTIQGLGIFAQVSDPRVGAVLSQAFMLTLVTVTLALALVNRDRKNAVTAAHALAERANDRAQELDVVLGNLVEGVVLFDGQGRIVLRNHAGRRMFGRASAPPTSTAPPADALGLRLLDGSPVGADFIERMIADSSEEPTEMSLRLESPVSASKVLAVRVQRVPLQQVADSRVVVTFRDVTQEHQRIKELESFAGVLAHDLRQPLTIVAGWAEFLDTEAQSPEPLARAVVQSATARLIGAADAMRHLLDDLLALTRADRQTLTPQPVDIGVLCREIAQGRVEGASFGARVKVAGDLGVIGDPVLLRQLFDNLISNALKYARPGVPPLVDVYEGASVPGWRRIRIQDNGVGIPHTDRAHVFDDFHRAEQHRSTYEGTGIGLAICRRVVERHDGRIRVIDTEAQAGTCIEVSLPRDEHPPPASTDRPPPQTSH